MSKKIRISELAQEINSSNKRVMELLAKIGINVSNASSSLTEEQVDRFYDSINFKRPDKTGDAADSASATAAPAPSRNAGEAARPAAQTGASTVNTVKDPRQAQPVIRKVVVHNSTKSDSASAQKTVKPVSAQAPSGLRQGLARQKVEEPEGNKEEEKAPAKPGVVRRITRKPAEGAGTAETAQAAAQTPAAENVDNAGEAKPQVRRIRRVEKIPAAETASPDNAAASQAASAASAAEKDAPEKSAGTAPDKASETATDAATSAAAPEKAPAVDAAKASGEADASKEKAPKEAAGDKEGSKPAVDAVKAVTEGKAADASADKAKDKDKPAKAEAPKEAAKVSAAPASSTPAAPAAQGSDAAKAAAPVRKGPVYISRARDNAGAQTGTGSSQGYQGSRTDGRVPRGTDRQGQGAGQRGFSKDKDDFRPGQRQGFQRDSGRSGSGTGTGSGFGGQGGQRERRSPSIPSVNPAVGQQEPRRDYAGKLYDKTDKTQEKTQKPVSKRDASRSGSGKVKYREERNIIGTTIGVNDLYAENYHESYDTDNTHAQKRSARTGKKDVKSAADARAAQQAAMALTNVTLPASMTVKEFAEYIKKTAAEVIKKLMLLGTMATQNQVIDFDTAALIASEFGITAEQEVVITDEDKLFDDGDDYNDEGSVERPPVVVVMGHVDHGKTSLLDAIRKTSVTAGEAGGITQHIGAYMVRIGDRKITFLDTPGHEAFTAMRQRGAMVTDVAILVVAADDGVMPQTIEAINHAKAAKVSIVVAVNKMDKEGANLDRVMTEMAKYDIVPEDWGGDVPFVPVSAKSGMNIELLLETVLLSADVLQLKANPDRQAKGTIIEAKLDKNKGPVATLLVQRGTLRTGDAIVSGVTFGRVRTMTDDKGKTIKKAGPSTPVEITGLPEVPEAGELFYVVEDEHLAKHLVDTRRAELREKSLQSNTKVSLENLNSFIEAGKMKDLNIIVKADVVGSVEAVKQSLEKLSNDEVRINVIHGAVGAITESDVSLADVSNAIIIGFNVRPGANISESAKAAGVDIKLYRVIYDAIDDIKAAIAGMLSPKFQEVIHGHAQVRQTFRVSNVGTIAGAYVTDGNIVRNSEVRIVRDGIVVFEGKLASLKRFKDDVKEVATGYECGLSFENYNDVKVEDVVECYTMEEVKKA